MSTYDNQQEHYHGTAGWYHPPLSSAFAPTIPQTAPAVSSGPTSGMDEMALEDLPFDMDFAEWAAVFDYGAPINEENKLLDEQSAGMAVNDTELRNSEVNNNNASELPATPPNTVGTLNYQSSAVDSPKSPVYGDNAGLTGTHDQPITNSAFDEADMATAPADWASLLVFDEDEINAYQNFYTPPDSANDEFSALAHSLPHYEQGMARVYPEEVTPEGAAEPYHTHGGLARVADREWVVSSTSTLSSVPAPSATFNQESQGTLQARNLSGNLVGYSNSYPTEQGINRTHHAQVQNTTFGTGVSELNAYGGGEGSLARYPPTENGFGGPGPYWQSQGPVVSTGPVGFNTPATSSGAVDQSAAVDPGNSGFIPLFFTEQEFENRKAAREATRVRSDYPWNDIPAQHEILRRLYNAIRNTTGVTDSSRVADKFADHSKIPDLAVHETCWEVMIHCRDSQELKGLLVGEHYHKKYNVKETFTERIESVIAALHTSKAICKSAMDPSFLDRLADQPEDEKKQKSSNKRLNQVKTAQNKAGQKAISLKHADKDGAWRGPPTEVDDDEESEAEPAPESSRPKRKREAGGAAAAAPAMKRRRRSPGSPSNMA